MDCNTARMLATFFGRRGTELAPEDAATLDAHLSGCPTCAAAVQAERAFDDRVAAAMLAVPVPSGLQGRLLDGVAAERGAWYRHKFYALAGLAAGVLLSVGGLIAWQVGTAPELTLTEIVRQADTEVHHRQQMVDDVLRPRGLAFQPDGTPFDLNQLARTGVGPFQGRDVPFLYFINRGKNAEATVYVIRDTDFDWKQLPRDGASVPSAYGYQVAILLDRHRSDVGYIVVFTGAGLDVFLEERSSL